MSLLLDLLGLVYAILYWVVAVCYAIFLIAVLGISALLLYITGSFIWDLFLDWKWRE